MKNKRHFLDENRLIRADGTETVLAPPIDESAGYTLIQLQGFIGGGFIEILYWDDDFVAIVDEDGLAKKLPGNVKARIIAGRPIVGDVAIIKRTDIK
jgi:hypothetical protein